MSLADTHCHLNIDRFDADRAAVIERARLAGVDRMLIPATEVRSSSAAIALAVEHPAVFAAVGIHPTETQSIEGAWLDELRLLSRKAKVVAIGEVGLDYYWIKDASSRQHQRMALHSQLQLAAELSLPVIIHIRERGDEAGGQCAADVLELLVRWIEELRRRASTLVGNAGVLHSFAGSTADALRAIELGFYIGITGPITYPGAESRRHTLQQLPMERLLLETDAPYLPPQTHRGQRNEPAFVADIADKIAEVLHRTTEEVARITTANAARLFGWGDPD